MRVRDSSNTLLSIYQPPVDAHYFAALLVRKGHSSSVFLHTSSESVTDFTFVSGPGFGCGCCYPAVTRISTLAPGIASSVIPIAVQAGQGSEMNSSRTFMNAPR